MEFRIFGPPGTGKTTRLATRDIPRAVEKYGQNKVMVTSFTKAAAREITFKRSKETGKTISVKPENVGTMHSILYHALGQPEITEVHYIDDWNQKYPGFEIFGGKIQSMDESCSVGGFSNGDRLLNSINIKRNKQYSMVTWTELQQNFYNKWVKFKQDTGSIDFTDLIEKGLYEFEKAPCEPNVIFVDEAQDFTQLQLSCIRNWGKHTEWIVLVGDDDQTIFEFTGADPSAFLNPPLESKFKTILKESYRVPKTVLNRALNVIERITMREKKKYSPRQENGVEAEGEVKDLNITYNNAKDLVDTVMPYLEKNMSVMFLGSCSYMLEPLKKELKARALPFQNKYRKRRRDWNPLQHQETLAEFLGSGIDDNFWNVPQFITWAKHLKVGDGTEGLNKKIGKKILNRLKQAVDDNEDGLHTCREVLGMALTDTAIKAALARDTDWYLRNITQKKADILKYPIAVYKKHGIEGIENEPLVTIGTIHSVKGSESDVVVLFPDVSYIADAEMQTTAGLDSAHRLFYVGMTRAKHSLILCKPIVSMNTRVPRLYVKM